MKTVQKKKNHNVRGPCIGHTQKSFNNTKRLPRNDSGVKNNSWDIKNSLSQTENELQGNFYGGKAEHLDDIPGGRRAELVKR